MQAKMDFFDDLSGRRLRYLIALLAASVCFDAFADTSTVTLSGAEAFSGDAPTTLNFPLVRSGDLGYDSVITYHTADVTALGDTDYAPVPGSITMPAGATNASIPVMIATNPATGSESISFQMVLDSAIGVGSTPTFASQQTFATGARPRSIIAADINGDGLPDVIVANFDDNSVSVFINTTTPGASTPSFAAQQIFAAGSQPYSVTVADINGDGKLDLVVADFGANLSILLNTTSPGDVVASFSAQQSILAGLVPVSVSAADINNDGRPDLVVTNAESTVSVLLNTTGAGALASSFTAPTTIYDAGLSPQSVACADINGDGKIDVVVANRLVDEDQNTISVLLNTTPTGASTPSFTAKKNFVKGFSPTTNVQSVALKDINGDGKPDLVVVDKHDSTLMVVLNSTAPGSMQADFTGQQNFALGAHPYAVDVVDLNGDGKPDVIVVNVTDNTVSVLRNITAPGASRPSFDAQQVFATGASPLAVTAADLNGDGKLDLIAANWDDASISVLLQTTASTSAVPAFAQRQTFATGSNPASLAMVDLNGDGKIDIVAADVIDSKLLLMLNSTGPGATTANLFAAPSFLTGPNPQSVVVGDLNGDGKPDLIAANTGTNQSPGDTVSLALNTSISGAATPSFAAQQLFTVGSNPTTVILCDINGDGKPDLVTVNQAANSVSVLMNKTLQGSSVFDFSTPQDFSTDPGPFWVAAADMNGDGKPDLIVANATGNRISLLLNTTAPGDVNASFTVLSTVMVGLHPYTLAVADLNGDGKADIIAANFGDGTISVLFNTTTMGSADMAFAPLQTFDVGTNAGPFSIVAADLNADGKPDIVVADFAQDTVVTLMNTTATGALTASFAQPTLLETPGSPNAIAISDVNNDGAPDIVVASRLHGGISVLLNSQFQSLIAGSPATGSIRRDHIFANGFE